MKFYRKRSNSLKNRLGFAAGKKSLFMHIKTKWIFKTFVLFLGLEASALPVSVSVSGTANTNAMGYTQGENYTFTWIVNDGYTGSILTNWPDQGDEFNSTENRWNAFWAEDPLLWSSVSGDGIAGTYRRPTIDESEVSTWDQLLADAQGLRLWAANNDPSVSLGLLVNGGEVYTVVAYDMNIPGLDYSDSSFINPAIYLANYTGTYVSTGGASILMTRIETVSNLQRPASRSELFLNRQRYCCLVSAGLGRGCFAGTD